MTDYYLQVLDSPSWKVRAHILKGWAGAKCEWCGSGTGLDVHHLSYHRLGAETPRELVVLCRGCHEAAHDPVRQPSRIQLLEITDRHPETFQDILEAERFEGTYL